MARKEPRGGGGYGRPPKEHQWCKGKSGNPRGRPRRKALKLPIAHLYNEFIVQAHRELSRPITINEGGVRSELTAEQAVIRSVLHAALKGDPKAQKLALELSKHTRQERLSDAAEKVQLVSKYRAEWPQRAQEARQQGLPIPLPRPEHFNFSLERGVLEMTGPADMQSHLDWDRLKQALRLLEARLNDAKETALADPSSEWANERVANLKQRRRRLLKKVPPGWDWQEEIAS